MEIFIAELSRSRALTFTAGNILTLSSTPPQALYKTKSKGMKIASLYPKGMIRNMIKDFSPRFSLKNWSYLRCPKWQHWHNVLKWIHTVEARQYRNVCLHYIYNIPLHLKKQRMEESVEYDPLPFFKRRIELSLSVVFLCDPMDCSPLGSSVHGIFQARILEWVAISYSRGSSQARDLTCISCTSCIGRWILYCCTTWDPLSFFTLQVITAKGR